MYRIYRYLFAAAIALAAAAAGAAPLTYTITSKLSRVNLSLVHQGFIELSGTLKITPGNFVFDNEDWSKSSVSVTMPTASIDMGDAHWNEQIRGDASWKNLFDTRLVRFRSTRVERLDATHGVLHGELTLAGVTRPVSLQMTVNKIGRNEVTEYKAIGITASTTIERSRFGLDAYLDLVSDAMPIKIQMEGAIGPDVDAGH
jgi:polyisoprenoid-binding protein YceI